MSNTRAIIDTNTYRVDNAVLRTRWLNNAIYQRPLSSGRFYVAINVSTAGTSYFKGLRPWHAHTKFTSLTHLLLCTPWFFCFRRDLRVNYARWQRSPDVRCAIDTIPRPIPISKRSGYTRAHFRLLLRNVIVRRGLDSVIVRNRVVVAFRAIRRLDRVRVRRYARMLFEGRSILPGYASVRDFEVRVSYCMSYRRRRNVVCSVDWLKILRY